MIGGYTGKILRVDLSKKSISTMDTEKYESWIGGHGMGSAVYWDLCKDKTLANGFDSENVICIMASPLSGTLAQASSRCEVQGIGPMGYPIEWFTRSNCGGRFSGQLKYAGWDGIAIEGKAENPIWINIINDKVTIEDARGLWGLNTMETQEEIWRRVTGNARFNDWFALGNAYTTQRPAVLCIGQAGEHLSRVASLIHDLGGCGQGGFGGVFGGKYLKAISVIGTGSVIIADPQALMKASLWYNDFLYNPDNPRRESPTTNNPTYGRLNRHPGRGPGLAVTEPVRPQACQACGFGCRRRLGSGFSNESSCNDSGLFKGRNLKEQMKATDLAQHYGINVYELEKHAYLYDLYKMGVLGPDRVIKSDLPWNMYNTLEFAEAFTRQIAYREGLGNDLAEGIARAAVRWGRWNGDTTSGLLDHPQWGYHQHYEPRVEVEWGYGSLLGERDINEHGINYEVYWLPFIAASNGEEPPVSAERLVEILASKVIPYEGDPFMFDYGDGPTGIYSDHRAKEIAWHRHYSRFWIQSVLYCDWMWPDFVNVNAADLLGPTPEGEPKNLNAVTGKNLSFADGVEIGRRIWNLDRALWVLQGRHRNIEVFTEYMYNVGTTKPWPGPKYEDGKWSYGVEKGKKIDRDRFEQWKTKFYELEGWDPTSGWPTRSTLEKLDLGYVANELQSKGRLGS